MNEIVHSSSTRLSVMMVAGSELLGLPFSLVSLHMGVSMRLFDLFGNGFTESGGLVIILTPFLLFLEKALLSVGWVGSKVLLFCFYSFLTTFTLLSS